MAFFLNTQKLPSADVHYHGKVLPEDTAPDAIKTDDPTVNYGGSQLPRDKKTYTPPAPDLTNNPSLVIIGGVTMPPDIIFFINGEKIVPMSKILDGVSVIEHVGRAPYEIEFEATLRTFNDTKTRNIFPQDAMVDLWTRVWLPDTIQTLQNTYLNKLGIQEIVIKSIHPGTVRGSTNVPFRMKTIENVPGTTLTPGP